MSTLNASDIQVTGHTHSPDHAAHPDCRRDNDINDGIFDDCDSGFFADACRNDPFGHDDCD